MGEGTGGLICLAVTRRELGQSLCKEAESLFCPNSPKYSRRNPREHQNLQDTTWATDLGGGAEQQTRGQGTSLINEQRGPWEREGSTLGHAGHLPPQSAQHPWDKLHPRGAAPGPAGPAYASPVPTLLGVPKPTPGPPWDHQGTTSGLLSLTCLVEEEEEQAPKHVHRPVAHGELCKKYAVRREEVSSHHCWVEITGPHRCHTSSVAVNARWLHLVGPASGNQREVPRT